MGDLFCRNSRYIYEGKNGEQTLLNFKDYLSNKSRISMHRFPTQKHLTIPEFLFALLEWEQKNRNSLLLPVGLIDGLLANQLIQTSQPIKMLEYGSGQGQLSFYLAELLGAFHEESTLICAHDTIEPEWMDRISKVEHLPKLSFFAGDFGDFQLQEDFFDIVMINGMVNFTEPYQVISDALRLAKNDAVILCYTDDTPLLESSFHLFFEQREEYEISPSSKVMLAKTKDRCWNRQEGSNFAAQALEDIEQAKRMCLAKETDKHTCFSMLDILKQDIKKAIEIGDIDLKLRLLKEKELLLQYALKEKE